MRDSELQAHEKLSPPAEISQYTEWTKMIQQQITNRLKFLDELPDVSVDVTGSTSGTIRITHTRHHAPEFSFRWITDHFVGYFIDGAGNQSQAVVSLYTPLAAIQFVSAYVMLNEIRANQKAA